MLAHTLHGCCSLSLGAPLLWQSSSNGMVQVALPCGCDTARLLGAAQDSCSLSECCDHAPLQSNIKTKT